MLESHTGREQSKLVVICEGETEARALADFVVLIAGGGISCFISHRETMDSELEDRFKALVQKAVAQLSRDDHVA